jgi:hypothetical protein
MTNIDYYDDVYKYLTEKFPDIPTHQILEASGYIAHRMIIAVSDAVEERDKLWQQYIQNEIKSMKSSRPIRRRDTSMNKSNSQGESNESHVGGIRNDH